MPLAWILGGGWKYIAIGIGLLACVGVYFGIQHIGALKEQVKNITQVANDNAAIVLTERKAHAEADALVAATATLAAQDRQKFNDLKRKTANAPPSADGPIAPVLRDVLDGLPEPPRNEVDPTKARGASLAPSMPRRAG